MSCSIPLDIPVDEPVTWKQLIGDRRLATRLTECDARGWKALPLAPKELCRLFPALWDTAKAAERWTAKDPQKAYIDIIRFGGFLTLIGRRTRRAGPRRWCGMGRMDARRSRPCWGGLPRTFG
jgi:hypothetical protein